MAITKSLRLVLALIGLVGGFGFGAAPVLANCPERAACTGCGCKGGPGYRGPDGTCVGFKQLERVCGDPPTTSCTFENAPGTGLNRSCALGLESEEDQ
ncbi:hypothetical protein DEVEQU_00757 [Devosia equisanguinis]|uniref:Uncharacterized protein n=1 Tax=Devosia equisanguinis TaxID=2490941 RepID=A0A447I7Y1_9HYPH|nr:hypothetical protein [Devosia equisanguinis]VDS03631.1 hypothetical protein DEVEQU_00757 [Devosia equisanguinis]